MNGWFDGFLYIHFVQYTLTASSTENGSSAFAGTTVGGGRLDPDPVSITGQACSGTEWNEAGYSS
jgi:hypothetical protein